jgi:3-oxoacid CoA-transferase subunit B
MIKGMGGAMDLVASAPRVIVLMEHNAKGNPKILRECSLPLTGKQVVSIIITELAVFEVHNDQTPSLWLLEKAPDVTISAIQARTAAEFTVL